MGFLYELLISPLGLPIPILWEYLIIVIIGAFAHKKAYRISPGGSIGSFIYWISKLLVFVGIWAALYIIIVIGKFIAHHWVWFAIIGGIIIVAIIVVCLIIYFKERKKEISN